MAKAAITIEDKVCEETGEIGVCVVVEFSPPFGSSEESSKALQIAIGTVAYLADQLHKRS